MQKLLSVGVLASGSGTNFQAILDAVSQGKVPARVAILICNIEGAHVLDRARVSGVPATLVSHKEYEKREDFEKAVEERLLSNTVDLVVLAGFMRVLSSEFVKRWYGRLINVHPSLLPAFPGVAAHRQALERGVKITGCTVHFVDQGVDTGPIIAQAAVPVLENDTEETLLGRIHAEEHKLLPQVIGWFAEKRIVLRDQRVLIRR